MSAATGPCPTAAGATTGRAGAWRMGIRKDSGALSGRSTKLALFAGEAGPRGAKAGVIV